VTPELAEQRRLRRGKRQHDRKESYSKHDTLGMPKGKIEANRKTAGAAVFLES
jgi:hypothetical protein